MLTGSAIKTSDGRVWSVPAPGRHNHVFDAISDELKLDWCDKDREQWLSLMRNHTSGFVTDTGEFLDREQAYMHALEVKQAFVEHPSSMMRSTILTSEDLW